MSPLILFDTVVCYQTLCDVINDERIGILNENKRRW